MLCLPRFLVFVDFVDPTHQDGFLFDVFFVADLPQLEPRLKVQQPLVNDGFVRDLILGLIVQGPTDPGNEFARRQEDVVKYECHFQSSQVMTSSRKLHGGNGPTHRNLT